MPLDVIRRLLTPLRDGVVTSDYPAAAPLLQPATRGLPDLDPEHCNSDGACVSACPTGAIRLTASNWAVDAGRCIFCNACAVACPNDAIRLGARVELASHSRDGLIEPTILRTISGRPSAPAAEPAAEAAAQPAAERAEERLRRWIAARLGRSLHIRHLDAGSCNGCDWEIAALLNPYHDIQRLGIDFAASPRHADLLLVTGVMTRNLEEAARRTYEAMPEPRLVVAVGACAISGGVFAGSAHGYDGIAHKLPVDVFVPGCPPRPEAIIEGVLMAVDRLDPESSFGRIREGKPAAGADLRGPTSKGSVEE
jgi:Ni,Fe-hydrogenase III small subunit/formate hydrogenlyase subunit 6/NADH:ubiquinone oxidoreductase subunit I